jgi:hypothetical protein
MAVDIKYYLSGGSGNTDPAASLGGVRSTTTVTGSTIFDKVESAEASAGDTEYRCVYIRNDGADTALDAKVFIHANTPSASTTIAIALAGEGKGGTAETVGNENTAPSGESFSSSPTDYASGLALGSLAQNEFFPTWIRRTVTAGAANTPSDTFTLRVGYDFA